MAGNIIDFDEGYDAFELDEPFDTAKSQAWQDGFFAAQRDSDTGEEA